MRGASLARRRNGLIPDALGSTCVFCSPRDGTRSVTAPTPRSASGPYGEAWEVLVAVSRHNNVKLRTVAEWLVATTAGHGCLRRHAVPSDRSCAAAADDSARSPACPCAAWASAPLSSPLARRW